MTKKKQEPSYVIEQVSTYGLWRSSPYTKAQYSDALWFYDTCFERLEAHVTSTRLIEVLGTQETTLKTRVQPASKD